MDAKRTREVGSLDIPCDECGRLITSDDGLCRRCASRRWFSVQNRSASLDFQLMICLRQQKVLSDFLNRAEQSLHHTLSRIEQCIERSNINIGGITWKVRLSSSEKMREKNHVKDAPWCSPPFYTSQYGYKMKGQCNIGTDEQRSVFLRPVVIQGDHDAIIPWPFKEKVIFSIISQTNPSRVFPNSYRPDPESSSFRKPTTNASIVLVGLRFPSVDWLKSEGFVSNDTLLVRCQCVTSDIPQQTCNELPLSVSCEHF